MTLLNGLDYIPIGAFVLNKEMKVVLWNKAMIKLTSLQEKDIINQPVTNYFPILTKKKYFARLQSVFNTGAPLILSSQIHKFLFHNIKSSDNNRLQNTTIIKVSNQQQDVLLFTCEDVTDLTTKIATIKTMRNSALQEIEERNILENKLLKLKSDLSKSNKSLTDFANLLALKLGMPLQQINTFVDFITNDPTNVISNESCEFFQCISELTENSKKMISDLLDYNSFDYKNYSFEETDLSEIVHEIVKSKKIKQEFNLTIENELPVINSTYKLLTQLISNILDNSIKFKKSNRDLEIKISSEKAKGLQQITITDNGIGFDMKHVKSIFDPFIKLNSDNKYHGFGFGLTIVKKIIELHQGTITAVSKKGMGTSIIINLPGEQT